MAIEMELEMQTVNRRGWHTMWPQLRRAMSILVEF